MTFFRKQNFLKKCFRAQAKKIRAKFLMAFFFRKEKFFLKKFGQKIFDGFFLEKKKFFKKIQAKNF